MICILAFFETQNRSELHDLIDLFQLQKSFFATWGVENCEKVNELSALNKKILDKYQQSVEECQKLLREGVQKAYRDYKKEVEKVRTNLKTNYACQMWSHEWNMSWIKQERDILKGREKRRSEQRREKRLRKKQRLAEAKRLNRLAAEENESDEE